MAQWGSWYPTVFLGLFLPAPWIDNLTLLLHLAWGGLGAYMLARHWKLGAFAASVAGFAYTFNGVSLACHIWGNYIASLGWLPWVFLCTTRATAEGGRWIAIAALASALQVLTATPELTSLSWLLLGGLVACNAFEQDRPLRIRLLRLLSIVGLAAGICMVQMLPFFDLLAHSQRDRPYAADQWAMPGWGWANLVIPLFHAYRAPQGPWFQAEQDFLTSYYLGAGILALAVAGCWLVRTRAVLILGLTALICWVLALGANAPLYGWVQHVFPWITIARFPVKFAILPAFILPLLAASSIDKAQRKSDHQTRRTVLLSGGLILVLMIVLLEFARRYPFRSDDWAATALNTSMRASAMAGLIGGVLLLPRLKRVAFRRTIGLGILALITYEGLFHSPGIAPTIPSDNLAPGMWAASGNPPAPKLGEGRIMISPEAEQKLMFSYVTNAAVDFTGKRLAEWYNLNLLDEVPKVGGALTLRPAHWDQLERFVYYTPGARFSPALLEFLSVAWYSKAEDPYHWVALTNHLPIITAGQRPLLAEDDKALKAITSDAFDPRRVAYLHPSSHRSLTISNQTACQVRSTRFSCNKLDAEIEAAEPSMVILSQTFYHLWEARVDGRPTPIWRANLAFQAVEVPKGNHTVSFLYHDPYLTFGAAVSLVSLGLCAALIRRRCG